MMTAHVSPPQVLNFRGRSLLAFVLEPTLPFAEWLTALDSWLVRSPTFFGQKPVILAMAGIEIDLKEYRDLLGALARRHIRVMGVENASRSLVGPHLPPVITGGRTVSATALTEPESPDAAPAGNAPAAAAPARPEPVEPLIVDGNLRSGQSVIHPEGDVTVVGRVASGAEIVAGGSVHVYGALQGRVIAGISGSPNARIFCKEAHAELLCIGGVYMTAENMDPAFEGRALEARLVGEELRLRTLD